MNLTPLSIKPTQKEISSSHFWLTGSFYELTHPLRSNPITEPSTLLQDDPPLCPASVLSLLWDLHLSFSLDIRTTGSHVPHKSLDQVHAIFMPDAAQAVNRFPLSLSWRSASTPVLTPSLIFRHLINGSLALISLILTWHSLLPCLFLNAHHKGSLPMQLEVVWSLLLQAGSEGPTLISCAVAHTSNLYSKVRSWRTSRYRSLIDTRIRIAINTFMVL